MMSDQNHHHQNRRRNTFFVPPPSPIPRAEGSRSAAADDETLNKYFSENLEIPYLHLPDPFPTTTTATANYHRSSKLPAQIDLRLVTSSVENSIERLIKSAKEFGVVRISGHGITKVEVEEVKAEVELFFRRLDDRKLKYRKSFVERIGNREEFVWFKSDKAMLLWAREVMGPYRYRDFSYKMESVVNKLEAVAEGVAEVLSKHARKRFEKVIQEKESIISLYRYNDMNPSLLVSNGDINGQYDYALSLHLPMERGEFYVQTDQGHPLSFPTDPDTIVVTTGHQLADWSGEDFKSVTGELIFDPNLHETFASYSLDLKCSPLNLNFGNTNKFKKKITVIDQILFALIIIFLYTFFFSVLSLFTQKH